MLDARRDGGLLRRRASGAGVRDGVGRRAARPERGGEGVERAVPRRELSAHRRVHPRPLHTVGGHPRTLRPHDVSISFSHSLRRLCLCVHRSSRYDLDFGAYEVAVLYCYQYQLPLPIPTRMRHMTYSEFIRCTLAL